MKHLFTFLMICMLGLSSLHAAHLTPSIQVNARCSGNNEVPAVDSDGYGLAVVTIGTDMKSANLIFQASGLSGQITGIHIHEATAEDNGPVVFNLTPFLNMNYLDLELKDNEDFMVSKLISGDYYLNVHTEMNPGGEIRGQFRVETDDLFGGELSGDNESPVVMSTGKGFASAMLLYSGSMVSVTANFDGIDEPITGIHLHEGAPGVNGPVVADLASGLVGNNLSIDLEASGFAQALRSGNIYLNVHTATNPGGEVRAQLEPYGGLTFDCILNGDQEVPSVTTEAMGLLNFNYDYTNNQISFEGFISETDSEITGAHLHVGDSGTNGGVITHLTDNIDNGIVSGTINNPSTALINAMLSGGIYLNIHTVDVPSGEIRGQINRSLREGYLATVNGVSEVPSNNSEATGVAMLSIDRNQSHGHYMTVVDGISEGFQASHFHDGGAGENGPVLFNITPNFIDGRAAFGYWTEMGESAVKIRTSGIYANYHTTAFPDGEIRGDYNRGSDTKKLMTSDVKSQIYVSSNNSATIGVYLNDYKDDNILYTFPANGMDADGIYYDQSKDELYQLNRSISAIDVYNDVMDAIVDGTYPTVSSTSTSDFSNGREMSVSGNSLVVAQDANAGNNEMNRFITYKISDDGVEFSNAADTDINLWGIQLTGNDLWAIVDNSDELAFFDDFLNSTATNISPTSIITIENMIRTHGLTYDAMEDLMILTDVGEASSAVDGAIVIIEDFMTAMADGMISSEEQIRIEGPMSTLGNPVDVAYDFNNQWIYVAERANEGGKILTFAMTDQDGDVMPNSSDLFPGASAVYFNSVRERNQFVPHDPQFDGRLLFTGRLSGNNEVPAVNTDATGVMGILLSEDMTMATFNLSVNGLSGPITGAHLHKAPTGENGDVVVNLSDDIINNQLSMEMMLDADLLNMLYAGEIYVNIHTEMNPNGELRAQLLLEKDLTFVNWITGEQEVPAVETEAIGLISANLTQVMNELEINAFFKGLSSPIIGAHLHLGTEGTNGDVVADLTSFVTDQMIATRIDVSSFVDDLRMGNIYLNIHTEENPNGEIRAQLNEWGGINTDGWLSGQQSAPMVSTAGLGLFATNIDPINQKMTVWAVVDNLSSDLTAAHLHFGSLGENGGVWVNLSDDLSQDGIMYNEKDFDTSGMLDLLKGDVYLNVHTADFPDGEIRGQAIPLTRDSYNYRICVDQENHDVNNAGNSNGGGILSLDRKGTNLHLMAVASSLSGEVTGVHLHEAMMMADGGVIYDLTPNENNGGVFLYGTAQSFQQTIAMPIRMGNVYINYHTAENPNGEIRGQIVKDLICDIISSVDKSTQIMEATVYPNPFSGNISIDYESYSDTDKVEIISNTGRVVLTNQSIENNTINLSQLEPGIYYLLIQTKGSVVREKLIKI